MSTVKIDADELGNVIRQSSKNPDYGFIRLTQKILRLYGSVTLNSSR